MFDSVWHSLSRDGCWAGFWFFLLRVGHYSLTFFFKYHFCEHNFVIVLLLFLSFIAKGQAMCRLGE